MNCPFLIQLVLLTGSTVHNVNVLMFLWKDANHYQTLPEELLEVKVCLRKLNVRSVFLIDIKPCIVFYAAGLP